jgi:hypothetical protein
VDAVTLVYSRPATTEQAAKPGERELKFSLAASRAHLARRWLDQFCVRDPEFPQAIVWTAYYDTPGLLSLGEKINSDYLKRKIRVRWYSDLEGRATGPAFVEAKSRIGNRREKARARLEQTADDLATWDLQDRRWLAFPLRLQDLGVHARDLWQPIMLIRYHRDRFVEPLSRSRVSLDSDIAAVAVNPSFVAGFDRSPLGTVVLEVKGTGDELPMALHTLLRLGARQTAFSKFLALYAHMTRRIF